MCLVFIRKIRRWTGSFLSLLFHKLLHMFCWNTDPWKAVHVLHLTLISPEIVTTTVFPRTCWALPGLNGRYRVPILSFTTAPLWLFHVSFIFFKHWRTTVNTNLYKLIKFRHKYIIQNNWLHMHIHPVYDTPKMQNLNENHQCGIKVW